MYREVCEEQCKGCREVYKSLSGAFITPTEGESDAGYSDLLCSPAEHTLIYCGKLQSAHSPASRALVVQRGFKHVTAGG